MDPDENIRKQLEIAMRITTEECTNEQIIQGACELAELVRALDGWITRGGFIPARWHALT